MEEEGTTTSRVTRSPGGWGLSLLTIGLVSLAGAILVGRITFGLDGWLWNLDTPKIDYPWAAIFHQALTEGRLPIWNDDLGLGFPLYAEGQIGAFYPPNWLVFQLDPLPAMDLHRLLHLTMAGIGAGLLALRVSGSRQGALVAAAVAAMGGAIVTKLEWWNFLAAYAWMPWVFLLLARRPPRRWEVVAAGVLWGVQALAGHPQVWFLTGIGAGLLLVARPALAALGRMLVFGGIGVAVGAAQWVPTAILLELSARAGGMPPNELFGNATTVFDVLLPGFANAFIQGAGRDWDYTTNWYPDGQFALLNAGLYVGLPALALAALALRAPRARRWLLLLGGMLLIPIVAAFQPEFWSHVPVLSGMRSPVRAYLVVGLAIGVLAAIGISRLGRSRRGRTWGMGAIWAALATYLVIAVLAIAFPDVFDALQLRSWWQINPEVVEPMRERAVAALTNLPPPALEIGVAAAVAVLLIRSRTPAVAYAVAILAVVPMAILMPPVNPLRQPNEFSFAETPFVEGLQAQDAHRVLTIGAPAWYAGMPNQLAAAGVPDIAMFSSLNLLRVELALAELRNRDPDGAQRQALGIDTVVTFGAACPGQFVVRIPDNDAYICRDPDALVIPYWVPAGVALPAVPPHTVFDAVAAVESAVPAEVESWTDLGHTLRVTAPSDGWLFVDRAWWPSWAVSVDGTPATILEASGAQLVAVPAGTHTVVAELTLNEVKAGFGAGLVAILLGVGWAAWPAFRARRAAQSAEASR
ncbi:MAG TPA: hypothetical protein VIC63_05310 [Candidatus Limnocylindria bacterium]